MTPPVEELTAPDERADAAGGTPSPDGKPARGRMRRLLRAVLVNGAVICVSLFFALLLAEFAVRIVAPQQLILIRPDLWQAADTLGWERRPDVEAEINTGERTVTVRTDRDGFRVGAAGRDTSGSPVLVLGDSFMEALQVEYENSFPGMLDDSAGVPLAVRNAGVAGWDPNQYLLRAREVLPHDDYRLVVTTVYLANDIVPERRDYLPPRTPVERSHFRLLPREFSRAGIIDSWLRPLNDALEVRSHLYQMVKTGMDTMRMRAGLHPLQFPPEFEKANASAPGWRTTADICADIAAVAAQHGAQALFVLIPAPFQVDEAEFNRYVSGFGVDTTQVDLEQPNRLLLEEFDARGLDVIDALPAFRAAHEQGIQLYGHVDPHLSPEGHVVLTRFVAPVVRRMMTEERAP